MYVWTHFVCTHSLSLPQDLYHEYCRYYNNGRVSVRDVAVGVDVMLCSQDYFYKTWAKTYPNLKLRADGDFMKCQLGTLFKGEIYGGGASGVTGVQDQAQMDLKRAEYQKHLKVGASSATKLNKAWPHRPPLCLSCAVIVLRDTV